MVTMQEFLNTGHNHDLGSDKAATPAIEPEDLCQEGISCGSLVSL